MRAFFADIRSVTLAALAGIAVLAGISAMPAAAAGPTVAVLNFDTTGLTSNWFGTFQPGVALSDLVTDQLVNTGKFNVVERKHLDDVMQEHSLSTAGETSPATFVQSGRLTGARYLVTGNIIQFEQTAGSGAGAAAAGLMGRVIGGGFGGLQTQRVTLKVQVHVVDAVTGAIVDSFADEQSKSGTSWGGGGGGYSWGALGAGNYSNQTFMSSTMGHLINDEAAIIANHIDPGKFALAGATTSTAHGRIISIDGDDVIINAGSDAGLSSGMMMNAISVKQIRDPDSGRMITSEIPKGVVQIVSTTKTSSVARVVNGNVKALEIVRGQ